jgi:hypothetical protein
MSDRVQEIYPAPGATWNCEEGTERALVLVHNVLVNCMLWREVVPSL